MDNVSIFDKAELEERFYCSTEFNVCTMKILTGQMKSGQVDAEQALFFLETLLPEFGRQDIEKLYNTVVFMMIGTSSGEQQEYLWEKWKDSFKTTETEGNDCERI